MSRELYISGYKRTTDKQYSLLIHEMARVSVENRTGKSKQAVKFWKGLTIKLNEMGPPYRTITQWKKVWSDFQRFHRKKGFKSKPKCTKTIKKEPVNDKEEVYQIKELEEEEENTSQSGRNSGTSSKVADFLRSETEEYEQNYQSINSLSNDYSDEYSYPDRHSTQQTTQETLIPDKNLYESFTYNLEEGRDEIHTQHSFTNQTVNVANHTLPPPLQPANNHLLDQTLYTFHNQIEHQTKLLEHLSEISSTMANLMERQVTAIEKQTEALRRQASATEHHTLVMNNFIDMLREKMPRTNTKTNLANGTS